MKLSFLPKPLLFKEWKELRWWLFAGFALLVYGTLSNLLALIRTAQTAGDTTQRLIWNVLIPILYHTQYIPGATDIYPVFNAELFHGRPAVSSSAAVVSMGLLIALITVERNRNTLWYTFSLPIRRADALRVKIVLAVSVVLSGFLLDFLVLLACDLAAHQAIPLAVLWQWLGENLLIAMTLMGIGLACAAVVQPGIVAGFTALILAAGPWGLGLSVLRSLSTNMGVVVIPNQFVNGQVNYITSSPTTPAGHISMFLRSLSPTSFFSGSDNFGGPFAGKELTLYVNWGHSLTFGLILWFLFISLGGGMVGVYAYLRAPIENSSHWVLFPRLEPWLRWLYYGALSFFLVNVLTANSVTVNNTPYLMTGYWLGAWLVIGLAATGIRRAFRRQAQWRTER